MDNQLNFYIEKCSLLEEIVDEYHKMQSVFEDSPTYLRCKDNIQNLHSSISTLSKQLE